MLCHAVFALLACSLGSASADQQAAPGDPDASRPAVVAYPAPPEEKLSEDFELKVGSQQVPVYQCRVSAMPFNQVWPGYQRPLDQTEIASFAYWDMSGSVEVEVISHRPVKSVAVRPSARGIQAKVNENRITFRMTSPQQITVEVNGWHKALHLFANAPQTAAPNPNDPGVRYFGPGVHRPGKIQLESDQTVYLADGAVVYGTIEARGASNIRILGRGILDTGAFERGQAYGCIRLLNSQNAVVNGIILRDPDLYGLSTFACSNVSISNVKLIGLWRYNSDGIDIHNSQDVSVRGCFVRSFDDSLVVKGIKGRRDFERQGLGAPLETNLPVRRALFEGCVVWNDWGRALEVGAETVAPEITDVTFRDCDIIRTSCVAMDIQHSDRAAIKNVLFEEDPVGDRRRLSGGGLAASQGREVRREDQLLSQASCGGDQKDDVGAGCRARNRRERDLSRLQRHGQAFPEIASARIR